MYSSLAHMNWVTWAAKVATSKTLSVFHLWLAFLQMFCPPREQLCLDYSSWLMETWLKLAVLTIAASSFVVTHLLCVDSLITHCSTPSVSEVSHKMRRSPLQASYSVTELVSCDGRLLSLWRLACGNGCTLRYVWRAWSQVWRFETC